MRKIIKALLVVMVVVLALTAFVACGKEHEHQGGTATCTEPAVCEICGDSYGEALGHNEVFDAAVQPTCTEAGVSAKSYCSGCGEVYVEAIVIPALGHTMADATCEDPSTCTVCGHTEGEALGHTPGAEATCTTAQTCTVCSAELVAALGHTEVVDAAVSATCTATGLTEGKHCSVCNEVLVAQTVTDKANHTEVVDEAVTATCTATGLTEGKHCSVCNEVLVAQTVTDKANHTEVVDAGVAATCTTAGKTEGKHCSVCNEVLVAQTTINPLNHKDENPKDYVCDVCHADLCTTHVPGAAQEENRVEATCTATGSYDVVVKCSQCGDTLSRETKTIPVKDHTPGAEATCTTNQTCTVCNVELNPARGHDFSVKGETVAPDFGVDGYTVYGCSRCDATTHKDPVDALVAEATADGDKYLTLEEALENGSEIVLLTDVVLDAPIVITSQYTLDLNGHTLTYNSTVMGEAMITNKGSLVINDSVGTGVINYNYTGANDASYGKGNYTISNAGTLTVNGGKITIANLRQHAKYPIDNNSTTGDAVLVINGGHIYNYNTSAIRMFCNSTTNKNSVTINGGLVEGYCAIWMQNPGSKTMNGDLTITGGEIRTTANAYVNGTSVLADVGSAIYCTIAGEGGAWSEDSFITITGGTFNENVALEENAPDKNVTVGEGATFNGYCEYHTHEYSEEVTTEATCGTAGVKTFTCTCGKTYTENISATGEHVDEGLDFKCDVCTTKVLPADGTTLTIPQAIELAKLAGSSYTTQKYYITGIVTNVYNTTYGNLYLKDDKGNQICIYGLYSADGKTRYDAMSYKPVEGDELTVYTILGTYSSNGTTTPQGKSAWLYEVVHNHTYSDATCTEPATCSCGETSGNPLSHNYVEGVCSKCNGVDPDYEGEVSAPTYVKVTSADQLTTGTYVLVVDGNVMTYYESSWVLVETFTGSGNTIVSNSIATWTLTVSGSSVTMKDSKGNFIKPKSGNNNGIQIGSYSWAFSFNNGNVNFKGTGSDTTILAANAGSQNKIRAYKTSTVSNNASGYPSNFTLYKLVEN